MNNSEIELALIYRFGLDAFLLYCDMISFMYNLQHEDALKRGMDTNELAYDYERDWWEAKGKELKERFSHKEEG